MHLLVTKTGLQLTLRSYFPMLFTYSKRINREAHHCTLYTLNQGLLKLYWTKFSMNSLQTPHSTPAYAQIREPILLLTAVCAASKARCSVELKAYVVTVMGLQVVWPFWPNFWVELGIKHPKSAWVRLASFNQKLYSINWCWLLYVLHQKRSALQCWG